MDSLRSYLFRKAYKEVEKLGDRLTKIEPLIDWEAFRPIIRGLYDNKTPKGGRSNVDEVVMVKLLVLQQWYGLSDPEARVRRGRRRTFFLGYKAHCSGDWNSEIPTAQPGGPGERETALQGGRL